MEDRLRKFAGVVEAGSFTAAATQLHVSQPALTTAIKKLERELQASLFVSRKPPLILTEAGEIAYQHIKKLEVQNNSLRIKLHFLAAQKPRLRVGMLDSLALTFASQSKVMRELKETTELYVTVHNSLTLAQHLQQGRLDMALIVGGGEYPFFRDGRHYMVGNEPLVAVARQPLDVLDSRIINDFLAYDPLSNTSRTIKQHFESLGIRTNVKLHSTSQQFLLQEALAGQGVAVVPYYIAKNHIKNGDLTIISTPIFRPIISREHKEFSFDIRELRDDLSRVLKQLVDEVNGLNVF